ncbi:helix-turn-helix domain-containing protein [Paracoccus denitrificans]|uniref:helix-turn-helix domain-containing protein n=1 Tax=Paracoccus denitrificans TaxID=266 RepID=UPI001E3C5CE3|nr:helix-turn-helix domain-containing protein [Paracoccus denitrificans]UFS64704.1 helix-turn-helix domain-containing protein [Paracoccus denitrificans]
MTKISDTFIEQQAENETSKEIQKNKDFSMVWGPAWDRLMSIPTQNAQATRLYALLAKHTAPRGGAVAASYKTLAEILGVSEMTIRRAADYLVNNGIVVRFRAGVGAFVYALNPEEVWKSKAEHKKYAAFYTMTLVGRKDSIELEQFVKKLTSEAPKKASCQSTKAKKKAKPVSESSKPENGVDAEELMRILEAV